MMKTPINIMLCVLCLSVTASATTLLNYQGKLVDTNGTPFHGLVDVVINVYTQSTGGEPIYYEGMGNIMVQDGLYSFNWGGAGTAPIDRTEQVAVADGSQSVFNFFTTVSPVESGSVTISGGGYSWSDDGSGSSHPASFLGIVHDASAGQMSAVFLFGNPASGTVVSVAYTSLEVTNFTPAAGQQFLEVVLDGDPLAPRALVTAVPVAIKAHQADFSAYAENAANAATAQSALYANASGNADQLGGLAADSYALATDVQELADSVSAAVGLEDLYKTLGLAYPTIPEPQVTNLYLVIDLSGGPDATNYPVSGLDDVPAGGWTDEYKTTKLVMRRILAGTFTMGSPTNELGFDTWSDFPETQHEVTLTKDFYIGVFEVTQKQWERVMGNWPSYFTNQSYRESRPVEQLNGRYIREGDYSWDLVDWPNNQYVYRHSFMGKLREKSGFKLLDLPTEAQWEYACRAGTTAALNSGQNLTNVASDASLDLLGRYNPNPHDGSWPPPYIGSDVSTDTGTASVGSYQPNAWGLYDMHGNVWEICLDLIGEYPGRATDPVGATSGSLNVARGGGWNSSAQYCRSATRLRADYYYPGYEYSAYGEGGFRLAMTMP